MITYDTLGQVVVWNYETNALIIKLHQHTNEITGVEFNIATEKLITYSKDNDIVIYDYQENLVS